MSKHTPGPWEWEVFEHAQGDHSYIALRREGGTRGDVLDGDGIVIVDDADANLIAAAPDLLSALESVEWGGTDCRYEGEYPICPSCFAAREDRHYPSCKLIQAIKKARGEG
jgi:hypothetical protein